MYIGIDLGGTKISALVVADDGRELARSRLPTPTGYPETLEALAAVVAELERVVGRRSLPVGLGLPGVVDPQAGTVQAVNLPWLTSRPFVADLAARLGRPVPMANDANCFALAEASDGAGVGAAVVFGVVLGTGVGAGIVIGGRCVAGIHGIAGEWGHTPLPWREPQDGPPLPCPCGRIGCIETLLGGAGLVATYRRLGGTAETAVEIALAADQNNQRAAAALHLYFSALARALASVINFLDPDVVVLGGGLSKLPGILNNVLRLWRGWALVAVPRTRLVCARYGADGGVRGAAQLARQRPVESTVAFDGGFDRRLEDGPV
jgi:fructokinase